MARAADLDYIITQLERRHHRLPTEDEVYTFIMGSDDERIAIWRGEN